LPVYTFFISAIALHREAYPTEEDVKLYSNSYTQLREFSLHKIFNTIYEKFT